MNKAILNQSQNNKEILSSDQLRKIALKRVEFLSSIVNTSRDLLDASDAMLKSEATYAASMERLGPFIDERIEQFNDLLNEITANKMRDDEVVSKFIAHTVEIFQLFDNVEPKVKNLLKEI